jgi:hypothetical protein
MNQRDKISNNFSDAYLLAMLEGSDTSEVVRQFSKDFPEMASQFAENAASLNLLYGDLSSSATPSENEIAAAYKKVSERFAPAKTIVRASAQPGFFAQIKSNFSTSPMWAGASLGIGVAVIIALLWQPWVIKESLNETAKKEIPTANTQSIPVAPENIASNDQTSGNGESNPMKMPEVQYRGKNTKQILTSAQAKKQDSLDAAHLKHMTASTELAAPQNLQIEPLAPGTVMVRWSATRNALSYIIEIKSANDANFMPVTQISQMGARITSLESGKTYFVRVIAASGERVGPASEAKSIVVP